MHIVHMAKPHFTSRHGGGGGCGKSRMNAQYEHMEHGDMSTTTLNICPHPKVKKIHDHKISLSKCTIYSCASYTPQDM